MRILHLIKHCESANGHVNVAVDLACIQGQRGHAVALASGGGTFVPLLERHGVLHLPLSRGRAPWSVAHALARLVQQCRAFRPDLIHAHMMSSAVLGFVASRLYGVPLVTTVHNSFDRHSNLMRVGDVVVAVSEAERRLLRSRGYPDHKLVTIHNGPIGSPREALLASPAPASLDGPSIITVSGLHARKGCHHLVEAFAMVAGRHPAWHFTIIGNGPDRPMLEARVAALGLASRVHFLGSVIHPQPWLQRADIFVLASLAEPFGLVLVEARAASCAIVATDIGGIPEVLDFGRAGQLVPAGSPDAIAATLTVLMDDPAALATWRQRSHTGVETFSAGAMADKYLALYGRLAAAERTRSTTRQIVSP